MDRLSLLDEWLAATAPETSEERRQPARRDQCGGTSAAPADRAGVSRKLALVGRVSWRWWVTQAGAG